MFKRIDHVEIVTDQLDRTVQFYTEVLGFTVKALDRIESSGLGVPINLVYLDLGGTVVELITYEGAAVDPAPRNEHLGYRMIALEVDDMQKTADYLRTKGVNIVWGPRVRETYLRAEICDPNGFHIELRQAQESGARLQHSLDMTKAVVEQRDQEQIALRRQLQNAGEIEKENRQTAAAVEGQIADLQKTIACREADLSRSMSIEGLDERTTRAVMTFKDRLSRGEDLKTAALGAAGYELTEVEAAMAQRDRDEMRALDALLKRPTWRRRVVLWLLDVRRSPNRQA